MAKSQAVNKTLKIAAFIAGCLEENGIHADKLVLFGSHANGSARKDSDLDIIIVSPSFRGETIIKRAAMISGVHTKTVAKFKVPLDLLLKTPEEAGESRFFKEGIVVWAA